MVIKYSNKELDLCARLMRAEALGEGETGMLLVGNVVVNRCIANCYTFGNIRTITDAIYEKNQFFKDRRFAVFFNSSDAFRLYCDFRCRGRF